MFFLKYLIFTFCAQIRLCVLPEKTQGIKTYNQLSRYDKILGNYFKFEKRDCLDLIADFDVYMLLEGKNMVGYVQYLKSKAFSTKNRKEFDMISFYCFTITKEYNGKGFSYRLFEDSIKDLAQRYKLTGDTIITLHLSSADEKMPLASKVYYSFGFCKGIFIRYDPREMIHRIDELFDKSKDIFDIAIGKEEGYGEGGFLMVYCLLKNIKRDMNNCTFEVSHGKQLFDILKKRNAEINSK